MNWVLMHQLFNKKNLLKTGDEFPYGQKAESEANECWEKAEELYDIDETQRRS